MIKVALVNPPKEKGVYSYAPQVRASREGVGHKPPLGLLYVATYLKEKFGADVEVKIFDCPAQGLTISKCAKVIEEFKPDVTGISAWSEFWYPAFTLGKAIKTIFPSGWLVYGGPHVQIYPEITLKLPHVDAVIIGDGEVPFYNLIKKIADKSRDYTSAEGLHFKGSGINYESLYYSQKDLDSLPIPLRTIVDIKNYHSLLFKGNFSSTMISSRGCPHLCAFCRLRFQKPISHSPKRVIEEFKYIKGLGIDELEIYDDTFTWSHSQVSRICEGIIKEGIKIKWSVRDRVDRFNRDLLKLMKQAGCVRIHYGIESGVQRILDIMKKGITLSQARLAVCEAKKLGLQVVTHYMLGNLDETIQDIETTINFALSLPSDYASFGITIPYPGTDLYEAALKSGIISYDYWQEYAKEPMPDFVLPQLIENLCTREELKGLLNKAMLKFYSRPAYIFRQIRNISSFQEFTRKAKMATGLFLSNDCV